MTHRYDEAADVIRIAGGGLWSEQEVDDHFAKLEQTVALLRLRRLAVRSLVDLREAAVQPKRTSERMAASIARIYRPQDRIALVLASSLLKAQMRHIVANASFQTFLSADAAKTWLCAYDGSRPTH